MGQAVAAPSLAHNGNVADLGYRSGMMIVLPFIELDRNYCEGLAGLYPAIVRSEGLAVLLR